MDYDTKVLLKDFFGVLVVVFAAIGFIAIITVAGGYYAR
jgi:hypothetical protein